MTKILRLLVARAPVDVKEDAGYANTPAGTYDRPRSIDLVDKTKAERLLTVILRRYGHSVWECSEGKRSRDTTGAMVAVAVDYDDGTRTFDQVVGCERSRGCLCIVHATTRHTDDHPRIRVLYPLERPIEDDTSGKAVLEAVCTYLKHQFPDADPQVFKVSQPLFPCAKYYGDPRQLSWSHANFQVEVLNEGKYFEIPEHVLKSGVKATPAVKAAGKGKPADDGKWRELDELRLEIVLDGGVPKGERDLTGIRIAIEFNKLGREDEASAALSEWVGKCDQPDGDEKGEKDVARWIASAETGKYDKAGIEGVPAFIRADVDARIGLGLSPSEGTGLVDLLKRVPTLTELNPAQDYYDGVLYYAIDVGLKQPYLLTSKREYFPMGDGFKHGLRVRNCYPVDMKFSPAGIKAFYEGTQSVTGDVIYRDLYWYLTRYFYFHDPRVPVLFSLWTLGTYVFRMFNSYPYIWIHSEKDHGKTALMELLEAVTFNGDMSALPTEAVLYRKIADNSNTLFIDEVEKLRSQDHDNFVMYVLNVGIRKKGKIERNEAVGKGKFRLMRYPAYSPKCFAGIQGLTGTLRDRSIEIRLLKRKKGEGVEHVVVTPKFEDLQRKIRDDCYIYCLTHVDEIAEWAFGKLSALAIDPSLTDRARDLWFPIFVMAEMIDKERGNDKLGDMMVSFYKSSRDIKRDADADEGDTTTILTYLKEMFDDTAIDAVRVTNTERTYTKLTVFHYMKNTEAFHWLEDKHKRYVTSLLKRIGFTDAKLRTGERGSTTPTNVYVFDMALFDDRYERYVTDGKEERQDDDTK